MNRKIKAVIGEVSAVIQGKDEVIKEALTAVLAGGHVLLEDVPGVGKTTLAIAMSRALSLDFNRVQFTPDVVPSDITGFTMYDRDSGKFQYRDGAVICNFFLADEINRTSSKTQSALLEAMAEGKVTVDGEVHEMPQPFIVMATENPFGAAGTQMLPEAQLDRFMIKTSMGYPDFDAQIKMLKARDKADPLDSVRSVVSRKEIIKMKEEVRRIYVDDKIYRYITMLSEATRSHELIRLGISPRGSIALCAMSKAAAYTEGRGYVTPEDVKTVFRDVFRHRVILRPKADLQNETVETILTGIMENTAAPKLDKELEGLIN